MCDFCKALIDDTKKIIWNMRSTFADDNICEYVNGDNCDICNGCKTYFEVESYFIENDVHISIEFYQKLRDKDGNYVLIRPFTEGMQWNFCPVCGEQISENLRDISKEYAIEISNN